MPAMRNKVVRVFKAERTRYVVDPCTWALHLPNQASRFPFKELYGLEKFSWIIIRTRKKKTKRNQNGMNKVAKGVS